MIGLEDFLEWLQGFVEERWGKFWSWIVYFGLLAALVVGVIVAMRIARRP